MSIYSNIEELIKEIFTSFSTDDKFLRLVSNDETNALNLVPSKTFNQLINDRLWLTPKKLDPSQNQGTYIMIYLNRANRPNNNDSYQNDITFYLDFLCHEDIWLLDDWKIRPYQLLDVVKTKLESISTTNAIKGELNVGEPRMKSDYFYFGYTIEFTITGITSKMCSYE